MVVAGPTEEQVDRLFHALADPTRRDILRRCTTDESSVTRLASTYPMSFAAVQKHVAVLERAHGVDAVDLALRSATGRLRAVPGAGAGPAVAAQLRSTLPPGTAGRVTGRLPDLPASRDADVVAVTGYERGDRLDGWYDALLATVSAGGPDTASAARAVAEVLTASLGRRLSEVGLDPRGARPWGEAIVGFIEAASLWWIEHPDVMTRDELRDYLSALLWGGVAGVLQGAGQQVDARPAPGIFPALRTDPGP